MAIAEPTTIGSRIVLPDGREGVIASSHHYSLGDVWSVRIDRTPATILLRSEEFVVIGKPAAWTHHA